MFCGIGNPHEFEKTLSVLSTAADTNKYSVSLLSRNEVDEGKSIYEVLESHLAKNKYLAGANYSIADIATWPWVARHQWHDIGLRNYQNLSRWYSEIAGRDAVIKGFAFMDKGAVIPKP